MRSVRPSWRAVFLVRFTIPGTLQICVCLRVTAMTSHSAGMVALNDLLSQQLQLSRQLIAAQRRLHRDLVKSLGSRPAATSSSHMAESQTHSAVYQYTTLGNTRRVSAY